MLNNAQAPELAIQKLLRREGIEALTSLAIKVRLHPSYPELYCFKYDQRLSPMSEAAVQDARGLILDRSRDWAVTSMAFRKFFNLGEPLAASPDWSTARIEEKLDGSLMCLYWYDGAWQVQTTGTADAGGMVVHDIRQAHAHLTYHELFWQTWQTLGYRLPPSPLELGAPYTFAFELLTPHNRVVIQHDHPRLVLHGVRNLNTLGEEAAEVWAARLGYEAIKTFSFSPKFLLSEVQKIPPLVGEGYVVRDVAFQRVKVKSEHYVHLSLLRESWSPRRALEIVLMGESDEFLTYFPEYLLQLEEVRGRIQRFAEQLDRQYAELKHLDDQKAFAAEALKRPNSAALFQLRLGRVANAYQWLLSLSEGQRLRALAAAGEDFSSG